MNEVYNWIQESSDCEIIDDIPGSSPVPHNVHTVEQSASSYGSRSSDPSSGYERVNDGSGSDELSFNNSDENQDEDEHGYEQMAGDLVSTIEALLMRNKNEIIDFVNKQLAGIKNHMDRSIQGQPGLQRESYDYNYLPYVHPFPHLTRYRSSDLPRTPYPMDSGIHSHPFQSIVYIDEK